MSCNVKYIDEPSDIYTNGLVFYNFRWFASFILNPAHSLRSVIRKSNLFIQPWLWLAEGFLKKSLQLKFSGSGLYAASLSKNSV